MMKTRDICQIAILAAIVTAAKFALSSLANIELVTTLLISYSLALGVKKALPISLVFIVGEVLLYGFSPWVLMYLIHWQSVVIGACLVRNKKHSMVYAIIIGIILTVLYGVQTTFIETLVFGNGKWEYFCARYISGLSFFIVHIVCNVIVLPLLVPVLSTSIKRIEKQYNSNNGRQQIAKKTQDISE